MMSAPLHLSVFASASPQWVKFTIAKQSGDLLLLSKVISEAMTVLPAYLSYLPHQEYLLCPIPARPQQILKRSLSPQHFFAEALADHFPKRFSHDVYHTLKRIKHTTPQTGLSRLKRLQAQKNSLSFVPTLRRQLLGMLKSNYHSLVSAPNHSTAPKLPPLILIDDVVTTGSTLSEAHRAVQFAGFQVAVTLTLFQIE